MSAKALVDALASSKNFKAELKPDKESALLAIVSQSAFTKGTNPQWNQKVSHAP